MTRDVCYIFPVRLDHLYNAYYQVATNDRFRREPNAEPYHTIGFGLNFSMKYNINGGACVLHFMPVQNGTAVCLHFTIAQLCGANYEKYAKDLTEEVERLVGVRGQRIEGLEEDDFNKPENQYTTIPGEVPAEKPAIAAPVAETAPAGRPCTNCGHILTETEKFCSQCGTPAVKTRFCVACGAEAVSGALFCTECGSKLS